MRTPGAVVAFISNQWLNRGRGIRNRSNRPVPVNIVAQNPSDWFSRSNGLAVRFTATCVNSQYKTVHLTRSEVDEAAETIVRACSESTRERLASLLLREMSDPELLKLLLVDLKQRVAK